MFSVVLRGIEIVEHALLCAAARKAGASSPPLACRVHVPEASGLNTVAEADVANSAAKLSWVNHRECMVTGEEGSTRHMRGQSTTYTVASVMSYKYATDRRRG